MNDCTPQQLYDFGLFIKYLRSLVEAGITIVHVQALLANLKVAIDTHASHMALIHSGTFETVERLTINRKVLGYNGRIHESRYLSYPPSDKVIEYGRCNMPKQSVLYGSFGSMITYSELKPLKGDVVTISTWNLKNDAKLRFMPICANQPTNGTINPRLALYQDAYDHELSKVPPNIRSKIKLMNQFIADAFTRRVEKGNHLGYFFSAYFSDLILNNYYDGQVDAIYYPSVPMSLSFENLAIKSTTFDRLYQLTHVSEGIVDMDYTNSNGYMTVNIARSSQIVDGKIIWESTRLSDQEIQFFKDAYKYTE